MDELPPDPNLDDLPRELAEREGPLVISGVDEDRTHYAAFVTKDDLARGFADARLPPPFRPFEARERI